LSYTSKSISLAVQSELIETNHGMTFQLINAFVLSDVFLLITPIYYINDTTEDEFILEIEPVFDIFKDKFQAGLFYRGAFQSKTYTL